MSTRRYTEEFMIEAVKQITEREQSNLRAKTGGRGKRFYLWHIW